MVTIEPINVSWSLTTSMVSHDHHQTVRYGEEAGVSTAESTFSIIVSCHTNDHTTELQRLRYFGWRCLKQYDCKMVLQRWVCQMSKGGFWSSPSRRRNRLHGSCILPSRKLSIQKSFETKWSLTTIDDYLQGPTWPFKTVWVNHWSQIQNGTIWPIRSQQWFDKRSQWTSFQTFTFQS